MTIEEYRNCESARLEANRRRMEDDGVNFLDIYSVYIDEDVVIEKGATIAQNVTISGKSIIRAGAYIGQSSVIKDAEIGSESTVEASYIYESKVGLALDHSLISGRAVLLVTNARSVTLLKLRTLLLEMEVSPLI